MDDILVLIEQLGIPVATAIVMAFFIFMTLKYILDGVLDDIKTLTGFVTMLENRVRTMNNEIIKIDLMISQALDLKQIQTGLQEQKILSKREKSIADETRTVDYIVDIVNDYGFAVLLSLGMGYFIYYVWRYVTEKLEPIIEKQHITLIKLIDQVRMLDQDQIRMKQKLETVLEFKEKRLEELTNEEDNSTS